MILNCTSRNIYVYVIFKVNSAADPKGFLKYRFKEQVTSSIWIYEISGQFVSVIKFVACLLFHDIHSLTLKRNSRLSIFIIVSLKLSQYFPRPVICQVNRGAWPYPLTIFLNIAYGCGNKLYLISSLKLINLYKPKPSPDNNSIWEESGGQVEALDNY